MTPSLVVVFSFLSFLSDFLDSFLFAFLSSFVKEGDLESLSEVLFLDDFKNPAAEAIALNEEDGPEDVDDPFDDPGLE